MPKPDQIPTCRLNELLIELESRGSLTSVFDVDLPIDDPQSPKYLRDIHDAIRAFNGKVPVFKQGEDRYFLGFTRYRVGVRLGPQTRYYIQTCKGRVPFPKGYKLHEFHQIAKVS